MKTGHVRRTKPSRTGHARRARRRLWLASVALPAILIAPPVIDYVRSQIAPPAQAEDAIEAAVKKVGFDPLVPPSRLRGPGALYEVEDGYYRKVCDTDPALLEGKLQKSPIPSETRSRFESSAFSLSGHFLAALNAKLAGAHVTSIEYSLRDVAISEIAMSDLADIEDKLLQQQHCDEAVHQLLQANKKVCPGYAVLSATTSYKMKLETSFGSRAEDRPPIISAVQRAIEERTSGRIQVKGADELTGDDLFYGIQLSSLCITPITATEPSRLVESQTPTAAASANGI